MEWIAVIKNALVFMNAITGLIQSHRDYGAGWAAATAQALTTATAQTESVKDEIDKAAAAHSKDSTDAAFDQEFRRS